MGCGCGGRRAAQAAAPLAAQRRNAVRALEREGWRITSDLRFFHPEKVPVNQAISQADAFEMQFGGPLTEPAP